MSSHVDWEHHLVLLWASWCSQLVSMWIHLQQLLLGLMACELCRRLGVESHGLVLPFSLQVSLGLQKPGTETPHCLPCCPATDEAEAQKAKGEAVILCRQETSPEDVGGMHAAEGILTSRGGMTSHAAVVARGWGKPCCCGCEELIVDAFAKTLKAPVSTNCRDIFLSTSLQQQSCAVGQHASERE
jgi:phosphohistidine swiveling domain-containing protein